MEYGFIAIILVITGISIPLLIRYRVPWRIAMIVPSVAALLCGLLVFAAQQWLTWQSAVLWLGISVAFYINTVIIWRFVGLSVQRNGGRW